MIIYIPYNMNQKTNNSSPMMQLMMLMLMFLSGGHNLTDEQISAITQILLSVINPQGVVPPTSLSSGTVNPGDTVRGMTELAQFLGVSVPTANKLSQSGIFDAARLHLGTKKFIWDKQKLLEIARKK